MEKNPIRARGRWSLISVLLIAFALWACDSGALLEDGGGVASDAGRVLMDAGRALLDAGETMEDAGREVGDAEAQIPTLQRVITADTDPSQYLGGNVERAPELAVLVEGPFVLTNAFTLSVNRYDLFLSEDVECSRSRRVLTVSDRSLQGGRIGVPTGSVLCVVEESSRSGTMFWSGFRPYS